MEGGRVGKECKRIRLIRSVLQVFQIFIHKLSNLIQVPNSPSHCQFFHERHQHFSECKCWQFVWSVNLILQSKRGTRQPVLGLSFLDGMYASGAVVFLSYQPQTCLWDCTCKPLSEGCIYRYAYNCLWYWWLTDQLKWWEKERRGLGGKGWGFFLSMLVGLGCLESC